MSFLPVLYVLASSIFLKCMKSCSVRKITLTESSSVYGGLASSPSLTPLVEYTISYSTIIGGILLFFYCLFSSFFLLLFPTSVHYPSTIFVLLAESSSSSWVSSTCGEQVDLPKLLPVFLGLGLFSSSVSPIVLVCFLHFSSNR